MTLKAASFEWARTREGSGTGLGCRPAALHLGPLTHQIGWCPKCLGHITVFPFHQEVFQLPCLPGISPQIKGWWPTPFLKLQAISLLWSSLELHLFILQSLLPSPQGRRKDGEGPAGGGGQRSRERPHLATVWPRGAVWPAPGRSLSSGSQQWQFGRQSSEGQGGYRICVCISPGLGDSPGGQPGSCGRLTGKCLPGSPACLPHQHAGPQSAWNLCPLPKVLSVCLSHGKLFVSHTTCVSQVFFPLSLLFQVHWSFFLGKLGQRFLPVDLNLNFLQKLPVVSCQQWTLPWKEARVSP